MEKAETSLAGSRTVVELLPTSNHEDGATLTEVELGKKYKVKHEFTRDRQSEGTNLIVRIKEDARERKLPRPIGVRATSVAKVGAVGSTMSAAVLDCSRMSVAKKIDVQNSQRIVPGNYRKKKKSTKDKRHISKASFSCSTPPPSSSKSETLILMTDSSLESSRTSSDPSLEDKSASGPWVAELGMDERVTTKEEPSFTAWERATKGSLVEITRGVARETLPV